MSGGEYAVGVSLPRTPRRAERTQVHASPFFATIPFGRTSSMTIITT